MKERDTFETRLTAALERRPRVRIPVGFTASVMAALPAATPPAMPDIRPHVRLYAHRIGITGMVLLACALVVMPMLYPTSMLSWTSTDFLLEMLFAAQLLGLTLWPDLWPSR